MKYILLQKENKIYISKIFWTFHWSSCIKDTAHNIFFTDQEANKQAIITTHGHSQRQWTCNYVTGLWRCLLLRWEYALFSKDPKSYLSGYVDILIWIKYLGMFCNTYKFVRASKRYRVQFMILYQIFKTVMYWIELRK